jgi:microcystin-dependent protein
LPLYVADSAPAVQMAADAIAPCGAGAPHDNIMPYLTFNLCIALAGPVPPRS